MCKKNQRQIKINLRAKSASEFQDTLDKVDSQQNITIYMNYVIF